MTNMIIYEITSMETLSPGNTPPLEIPKVIPPAECSNVLKAKIWKLALLTLSDPRGRASPVASGDVVGGLSPSTKGLKFEPPLPPHQSPHYHDVKMLPVTHCSTCKYAQNCTILHTKCQIFPPTWEGVTVQCVFVWGSAPTSIFLASGLGRVLTISDPQGLPAGDFL